MQLRMLAVFALSLAGLSACASPSATHIAGTQATYTPLPTSTPYPPQATYTPLPTLTPYPTRAMPTFPPTVTPTPRATDAPTPPTALLTAEADTGDSSTQMLAALNLRRGEHKCPALRNDERLQVAAQAHADDIVQRGKPDHTGADGSTITERLERAGYPALRRSETIAIGRNTSPLGIVDLWLNESADGPHYQTVLNCAYTDAGIGVAQRTDGAVFWVVVYGQPK